MTTLPLPHPADAASTQPVSWRFILTIPFIYVGIIPFVLLDAFLTAYQRLCFPAWRVPLVRRAEYVLLDRAKLPYLNWYQRINCFYCSYANGLAAYLREIAARTEQYWCPVQHRSPPPAPHSRYHRFLPYGDARAFRDRAERLYTDFSDID